MYNSQDSEYYTSKMHFLSALYADISLFELLIKLNFRCQQRCIEKRRKCAFSAATVQSIYSYITYKYLVYSYFG